MSDNITEGWNIELNEGYYWCYDLSKVKIGVETLILLKSNDDRPISDRWDNKDFTMFSTVLLTEMFFSPVKGFDATSAYCWKDKKQNKHIDKMLLDHIFNIYHKKYTVHAFVAKKSNNANPNIYTVKKVERGFMHACFSTFNSINTKGDNNE